MLRRPSAWLVSALLLLVAMPFALPQDASASASAASAQANPPRPIEWSPAPEFRSRHYRILSDLAPEDTRLYAAHLDIIYEEYARRLSSLAQRAPEVPFVLMFAKERDYLRVLRDRYAINATGSGGMFFISPGGAALAFFTESLPRSRVFHVIQHEGFHQYAHSKFAGTLPPWLNEGLAEYFGEAIVLEGKVIIGQASPGPIEAIKKAIEQNATVDFHRMLTMTGEQWNANVQAGNASVQYMQAWSMVQYLSWADGGRYQRAFEGYLQRIHAGMPSERAFVDAFGTNDLVQFERAWKEWAAKAVPSALAVAAMRITFMAEGLLELSRNGVKVDGFDEMLSRLAERNFATEVVVHGRTQRIEANEKVLEIPMDALTPTQPVFDMIPPKLSRLSTVERKREEERPTPPTVTTRGLEPRELVLKWTRRKNGDFDYEILSPQKAPPPPKQPKPARREG
jgi:hypothetical protein